MKETNIIKSDKDDNRFDKFLFVPEDFIFEQ